MIYLHAALDGRHFCWSQGGDGGRLAARPGRHVVADLGSACSVALLFQETHHHILFPSKIFLHHHAAKLRSEVKCGSGEVAEISRTLALHIAAPQVAPLALTLAFRPLWIRC
jgi:hypothetical protein